MSVNQKKEDLLADLKAAVLNLHQHLQQEQQELEKDKEMLSAGASEDDGMAERDVSEWKVGMTVINAGPTGGRLHLEHLWCLGLGPVGEEF